LNPKNGVAASGSDFYFDGVPRISIVTPTFQQAATIRETIESVLNQDHTDLEYWVLDAGSKDGTVEILRSYEHDPRFHWISEPDKGQSDAINKGLARCTGEIFNWINSDDYLAPGALRRVAEAFEKNPHIDIVSGVTAEFRDDPPRIFNHIHLQVRATAEQTITVGVFCQPSTFWRTKTIVELGGADVSLHYVMDWNLWVRYLVRNGKDKVLRIDDLLAHYRHHAAAKTTSCSAQFYDEAKVVFLNLHLTLKAPAPFLSPEVEKMPGWQRRDFELGPRFDRARYLGSYAERMVRNHRRKNIGLAESWLIRAFWYKPWVTLWRMKMILRFLFKTSA
jgi:glycosyltransferase involved in cell wall biosynthesis